MITYWLMFIVPMFAGLSPWKAKGSLQHFQWLMYGVLLIILVGLRHQIGGDWFNYISNYEKLQGISISELYKLVGISGDIGYAFVHWICLNYFNGIYSTNFFCSAIFVAGLLRICKNMPMPWLALAVSIPYLVIVVARGYSRQAVAIGFIMWGLIDLINDKPIGFYGAIILGTLFHKTALFLLPIGYFYGNSIRNIKDFILFILLFSIAFLAFLAEGISNLLHYYVIDTEGMESSGAFIRVMMNVVSALVFLCFRKKWTEHYSDGRLWLIFSVLSLIMLPLSLIISTTIDRMALYLLPMQLVIFSRTPLFIVNTYYRTLYVLVILFVYIAAMYVWQNFGHYSSFWLPYKNILFQ